MFLLQNNYMFSITLLQGSCYNSFYTSLMCNNYTVRNNRGRVSNFNQSEARKHYSLASNSDWSKFVTLPRLYRTLLYKLTIYLVDSIIKDNDNVYVFSRCALCST